MKKISIKAVRPLKRGSLINTNHLKKSFLQLVQERSISKPHFSGYWLNNRVPKNAKKIEEYDISDAKVEIFLLHGGIEYFYYIDPLEYKLSPPLVRIVRELIEKIATSNPRLSWSSYEELRQYVTTLSKALIPELVQKYNCSNYCPIENNSNSIEEALSRIVTKYTVGLGLIESLLTDPRIEDIFVDAPVASNCIYITLKGCKGSSSIFRCATNINVTEAEVDALVSRFRHCSAQPFSEAFPVMEIDVTGFDSRATVIGPPLSPNGTAIALRKHSVSPWTLLKFAYNETIDCFMAGLISFLIDGRSTILICGPRGSGKTAFLGASLFEFPKSQRILTIEDTPELPVRKLQQLGHKVQSMVVESEIGVNREERMNEALRVSLRLGESAIVLGEVRGKEAITLYESMRTGKAGSSVLGTIHGESAKSVYERVVHDFRISKEVFGVTDVVITLGLCRPRGSQAQTRKVVEIAELKKGDNSGEFQTLAKFEYGSCSFCHILHEKSEVIDKIARSWNISYDETWNNIQARAKIREVLISLAYKGYTECLEPEWISKANEFLWQRMTYEEIRYETVAEEFRIWACGRLGISGDA